MVKKAATKKAGAPTAKCQPGKATPEASPEERLYDEVTESIARYHAALPEDASVDDGVEFMGSVFNVLATHLGAADRMLDLLGVGLDQRHEHLIVGLTAPEGEEGPDPLSTFLLQEAGGLIDGDGNDSCAGCDCGNCLLDGNPATDPKEIN